MFTHWAVLVGSHYYELLLDHAHPNLATCGSGSLYGSQIRMNVGDAPVHSAWTSIESKGWTHFSDAEIYTAGVFALVIMIGSSNIHLLKVKR